MTNPVMLPYQNSNVSQALYYTNDLAFDEDDELFLQLGTSKHSKDLCRKMNLPRSLGFSCGIYMVYE